MRALPATTGSGVSPLVTARSAETPTDVVAPALSLALFGSVVVEETVAVLVNMVPEPVAAGTDTTIEMLEVAAFANAPLGTRGNATRGMLTGPGFWNTDLAFSRNVNVATGRRIELRIEAFNLFNNVNWANPNVQFFNNNGTAVGSVGWDIVLASLPYGLLCTTVLMGKHIDKIPFDEPLGIHTLPVILGVERARVATLAMMVGFYVLVAVAVVFGAMPWPALLVVLALPRLCKVWPRFRRPPPDEPPAGYPVWPLWYAALAWLHVRQAGALLVLGLAISAVLRVMAG